MSHQKRFNEGKPQLKYIMCYPNAVKGLAEIQKVGEEKYGPYNFMKGCPASQSIDSGLRHLFAWWNGEDKDPETGVDHRYAFLFNVLQLANNDDVEGFDDRPQGSKVSNHREDPSHQPPNEFYAKEYQRDEQQ